VLLVDDGIEHRVDVRVAAIFRRNGAVLAQRAAG